MTMSALYENGIRNLGCNPQGSCKVSAKDILGALLTADPETLKELKNLLSSDKEIALLKATIKDNLIDVKNAHKEVTHKAFNKNINLGE